MKKIVPFKKEIAFTTNLSEITSISLEHSLHVEDENIKGEFIISGDYKMTDTSIDTEQFNFALPFEIEMDDHYDLSHVNVDIDDFYYEIVNNRKLLINIDVLIDKLEEKPLMEEVTETVDDNENRKYELSASADKQDREEVENPFLEVETAIPLEVEKKEDEMNETQEVMVDECQNDEINTLFNQLDDNQDATAIYRVYIIREGDTIESVMQKYGVSKESIAEYNDLNDLKIGDKLIIPANKNAELS